MTGPTSASEAEREAERLRRALAGTLEQLAGNLAPSRLAAEAAATAREHTPDWLKRYWAFAQSPMGLAIIGGAAAVGIAGTVAAKTRSGKSRSGKSRSGSRLWPSRDVRSRRR